MEGNTMIFLEIIKTSAVKYIVIALLIVLLFLFFKHQIKQLIPVDKKEIAATEV
jgi:hypothetical protein